ncbi:MAG TPA: adenosylcobinamide amidohydrolase, partial [Chloroflexota bacterium]|nr:adenosylcobinamide amidohydrolase [Chloroflexota bacterium]
QKLAICDPVAYRESICKSHGFVADRCATLGTAANMNCLAIASDRFRDLEVIAVCTGGVESNAGRAGDPASLYEWEGRFEPIADGEAASIHGTINTMVFISQELLPGAMVRTVMTATEAKTAVLQELSVGSRYSEGLATGTGTDGVAIACRLTGKTPLSWAGKHSKLGELVGRTVHDATKQTLALQNSLTPLSRCSVLAQLERFGATRQAMIEGVEAFLSDDDTTLFRDNLVAIDRDPLTVAAASALAHLQDSLSWGTLPDGCRPEILCSYGAQLASAVSGKPSRTPHYRAQLGMEVVAPDNHAFLRLIFRAMAVGFRDKWR